MTDADYDGFGVDEDCDDGDPAVYPGAPDLCGDGRVTDCDRTSDEGLVNVDGAAGFGDLGAALAAAKEGSALVLCPGTYVGTFAATVPVSLTALEDASTTFLVGDGLGTVLSVPGGSAVSGLAISGGQGVDGGGLALTGPGTLALTDVILSGNGANTGGGLAIAAGGVATLTRTTITDNDANGGGGVHVGVGATLDLGVDSVVTANRAQSFGGGVWLEGGHLVGGVVSANQQTSYSYPYYYYGLPNLKGKTWAGGGVATNGVADITGTEIAENLAPYGGGISMTGGAVTLTDVSIHDNLAIQLAGGMYVIGAAVALAGTSEVAANVGGEAGGGEVIVFGSVTGGAVRENVGGERAGGAMIVQGALSDQTLDGNSANYGGGGVFAIGVVALTDLTVTHNGAESGGGLATLSEYGNFFYNQTDTLLSVTGCRIESNDALLGGGIASGWGLDLRDSVVTANTAEFGAGVYVEDHDATVTGGEITGNVGATGGGGVGVSGGRFTADTVDFGAGASDNTPSDASAGGLDYAYGSAASFSCDKHGCD